jgi:hypothetical protein
MKFILHIMLRDLLTQKCAHKIKLTDFGYPRAELVGRPSPSPRTSLKSETENFGL